MLRKPLFTFIIAVVFHKSEQRGPPGIPSSNPTLPSNPVTVSPTQWQPAIVQTTWAPPITTTWQQSQPSPPQQTRSDWGQVPDNQNPLDEEWSQEWWSRRPPPPPPPGPPPPGPPPEFHAWHHRPPWRRGPWWRHGPWWRRPPPPWGPPPPFPPPGPPPPFSS